MYTKAIVYSKANCPHCTNAVMVLNKAGIEVEKKIIGEDISVEDLKKMLPDISSVPQIYLYNNTEEVYIGGYVNLLRELENHAK